MILNMRADEGVHMCVNHHFADIPQDYHVRADRIIFDYGKVEDLQDDEFSTMGLS